MQVAKAPHPKDLQTIKDIAQGIVVQINVNREDNRVFGVITIGSEDDSSLPKIPHRGYNSEPNKKVIASDDAVGKSLHPQIHFDS